MQSKFQEIMLIDKRTFANAWRLYAQIQQLSFQSFCCQISLRKIVWGDTRIWTMDLSDCSRLLYHWAISPPAVTGGGHMARGWGDKIGSRQCAHAHLPTCPPGPPCSGHSYLTPVAVAVDTPTPQRNIGRQTDRQTENLRLPILPKTLVPSHMWATPAPR